MTLRMYRVSAARWAQLAASRHPIDLVEEEASDAREVKGRGGREEHADIQVPVDAVADRRASVER